MVTGKCTNVFWGIFLFRGDLRGDEGGSVQTFSGGFFDWEEGLERGGYVGETFHRGICHGGRRFP